MENDVFTLDKETLAQAVKKAGYAYADEYGWDNRFPDFNLFLQEELGKHIKQVVDEEYTNTSQEGKTRGE